eukprot:gene20229-biopygen23547
MPSWRHHRCQRLVPSGAIGATLTISPGQSPLRTLACAVHFGGRLFPFVFCWKLK